MTKRVVVGFYAEGPTDERFFTEIIERTLHTISFECRNQIDWEFYFLEEPGKSLKFVEEILKVSENGLETRGITILIVHSDADGKSADSTLKNKIYPAMEALSRRPADSFCKILVPLIPVQAMEAWLLADIELLKKTIGTNMRNIDLGIHRAPESISKPKEVIEKAIQIVNSRRNIRRGHQKVKIGNIYLPIGQNLSLEKLNRLPSYQKFKESLRGAFQELNLM